jgi:uncharacterized protein with HEPN domain
MPRSREAYLADIIDACDSIDAALSGVDVETYLANRVIRSAVEREFIIIGEAIASLAREDADFAARITHARLVVGFRNRLAHDYAAIDDEAVLRIAQHDVSVLRHEIRVLLEEISTFDSVD